MSDEAKEAMTLEDYRCQARERWGVATPYRLGFMVGMADDDTVACPYQSAMHAARLFNLGRLHGKDYRDRHQALDNTP